MKSLISAGFKIPKQNVMIGIQVNFYRTTFVIILNITTFWIEAYLIFVRVIRVYSFY